MPRQLCSSFRLIVRIEPRDLRPAYVSRMTPGSAWRPHLGRHRKIHYESFAVLTIVQRRVALHFNHLRTATHKLEIIQAEEMTLREMCQLIGAIVCSDPSGLNVTRVDLSVDVNGVDVQWFRDHVYIRNKRTHDVYGRRRKNGVWEATGLYFGIGQDVVRIYDKIAEMTLRHRLTSPRFAPWPGNVPPKILTRVERQLRSKGVPKALATVDHLRSADHFNPFAGISLTPCCEMHFGDARVHRVLAGRGLASYTKEIGRQAVISELNRHSKGNASRIFRSLERHDVPLSTPELYELYSAETRSQVTE